MGAAESKSVAVSAKTLMTDKFPVFSPFIVSASPEIWIANILEHTGSRVLFMGAILIYVYAGSAFYRIVYEPVHQLIEFNI
ncbi:MAG: hypothetical protein COC20_07915 [Cellvibrionales bacterium]|nr:MAG: hypothetical protein COC20_07915 [Cellvibrionales bacterium]